MPQLLQMVLQLLEPGPELWREGVPVLRPDRSLWQFRHEHIGIAWPGCNGLQKNTCMVCSMALRVHIGNCLHRGNQHLHEVASKCMCWTTVNSLPC